MRAGGLPAPRRAAGPRLTAAPRVPPVGPSLSLDTACSSSLLALHNAYQAIRSGECPAALVAGINLLLKPHTSLQFMRLGMLSAEGTCKSFDDKGEAVGGRGHPGSTPTLALRDTARRGVRPAPEPAVFSALRRRLLPLRGCGGRPADQEVPGPAGVRHHPEHWHQHRWLQGARWAAWSGRGAVVAGPWRGAGGRCAEAALPQA